MDTPPPQITNRYIPAEILEKILLNLPVKSLLRFSSASKSWNSIIHEAHFMKKYPGNDERIILHDPSLGEFLSCPLSAVLSNSSTPIEKVTNHVFPLNPSDGVETLRIIDVGDGLWFVENRKTKSMFLWNAFIRTYRKLSWHMGSSVLCYGLGYDSVGDDYKLLKICNSKVVLYSLRTNYFRRIKSFPMMKRYVSFQYKSCCVRGTLHWLCKAMSDYDVIFSFDLSTEEYGELALPPEYYSTHELDCVKVIVLRGKLCLSLSYNWEKSRFVLWVMEDYGVVESWTKKFDVDFHYRLKYRYGLRPLYICDNRQNAIFVNSFLGECWVMNKNGKRLLKKNFGSRQIYGCGFAYVESLVSPAMYLPRHTTTLLDDA